MPQTGKLSLPCAAAAIINRALSREHAGDSRVLTY
jgi:hypothetical protein